jgi:hypothetical protein
MDFWKKLLSVQILHDNSGDIGYKKRPFAACAFAIAGLN